MKQNKEIFREDILSEARRIWFADKAEAPSLDKLVGTLGIHPKMLAESFGSAEGLLAEALSPEGKPPATTPADDEIPQLMGWADSDQRDEATDFVQARLWEAFKRLTPDARPELDSPVEVDASER